MAERIEEIKTILSELQTLETQANVHQVKDLLSLEIRRLNTELSNLQQQQLLKSATASKSDAGSGSKRYQIQLKDYAWDQSGKFVKFYLTLKNVHTIPSENVTCVFTERSLELYVRDLENKDYLFVMKNLLHPINPGLSGWKIKSDMVIVNAAKTSEVNWACVTSLEKKVSDAKAEKYKPDEAGADPSDGIMSLMKKMYDDGDDEMKRTIAKAWTESQNKTNVA